MKFICVIFASLLFAQAYAKIPAVFEGEDLTLEECVDAAHCIAGRLTDSEFEVDTDQLIIVEIIHILAEVVRGYIECQAILGDPPTRVQEIQHGICMTAWRASALINVVRVQRLAGEASESARYTWGNVQDACSESRSMLPCIGHLIEDPEVDPEIDPEFPEGYVH